MTKQKITIERALHSRSESSVWKLIATSEGLKRWVAEEVTEDDGVLTFTWGKPGQVYETRCAKITDVVKHKHIRFRWDDETDPDAYTELALHRMDVSGELALCITDFSDEDDIQGMTYMWNHDLDRLQHKTGI